MLDVVANYARVCECVARAAERCGRRPADVKIVCAAKTKAAELVQRAIQAGATDIGENYVQEAQRKMGAVATSVRWHFIGHLQRNKARLAVPMFSLIHSLDSPDLARELERQAKNRGIRVRALIEINAAGEYSKSGIDPDRLEELLEAVSTLPNLFVEGLMTIPPPTSSPEAARPFFRTLARLRACHITTHNIANSFPYLML